ncbi:nuclear transport factor 2 family protein [Catenovulum sp. SM1970]|uniref:nuclear transport factor 2 family protein n=1 Tax=Marinifaba aquimaris TaxID=2741323 RepID=UPI001572C58B|nr:nuclear transport factor 2 family protein [Marinifaba aquimaris]NTS76472.1 nuclear transport factor 2 family protein [Marinifaba aquimaris]
MAQPKWLQHFLSTYQALNKDNLARLTDIYHDEIEFEDPLHKVVGLTDLNQYFANLYENVTDIHFDIHHYIAQDNQAAIYWTMVYSHPKLNSGQDIQVEGHSLLTIVGDRVIRHRDYVDMGAMLYEHIPLLGWGVKAIKNRASR